MSRFFINHPVFAWVIAILISLGGVLAILNLGVESYPNIAPPTVSVSATYPGASAETTESSVTQVIEQQLTGIDNLEYFNSSSSASGGASITLTFRPGTDPDIAQVQVQNKVALATPRLPTEVTQQGIVVAKANSGFLMVAALRSSNPGYRQGRAGRSARLARARPDLAHSRRRQHAAVRRRILDEHLVEPRQAAGLRPVRDPGADRGARPERAVRRRRDRCGAVAGRARRSRRRCPPKVATALPSSSATSSCARTATARRCA